MLVNNLYQFKKWLKDNQERITIVKITKMNDRDTSVNLERKIFKVQQKSVCLIDPKNNNKFWFEFPKASEITFSDLTDLNGVRTVVNIFFDKIMIHHWILN